MALTRKLLTGMGLSSEQVDSIIDAHAETVDSLKDQISQLKSEAEELPEVKKKLDTAQANLDSERKSSWKVKYEALKEDFDKYKSDQKEKEAHTAKEEAYRNLLKDADIGHIESVMKASQSQIDAIEFDSEGNIKDVDELTKSIKDEWSDFIRKTETQGAKVPNPPETHTGNKEEYDKMSLADKMKYANDHPQEVAEWSRT